jgi:[ribosomal protein S18]-alanine N-acetyltransferase
MTEPETELPIPGVHIRRMTPADILAVVGIEQSVQGAPHWPRSRYEEALLVGSPRPRIALVASLSGTEEIAGFVIANLIAPEAELETIAVAWRTQRQGIGRRLLHGLVAELREQAVTTLYLEVRASNAPAIRLYEQENFKQIGVRARYYTDPEEDAVLMLLRLA